MKIRIEPNFTAADISKITQDYLKRVVKVTQNELMQIGLQFVRDARLKTPDQGGFNDDTGNLRSSIFFILQYDGEIVHEDFEPSVNGTDKAAGIVAAQQYAEELAGGVPKGWALITGAAMRYAGYVEALGYDVITGSTLGAKAKLEKAFKNVITAFS
jgi:hypothetical protein